MDGTVFDAWTRRRFGIASGGLIASLLTANLAMNVAAKKRRKKKKCGKRKKRCHGTCIKKTQCCRDSDCPAGTYCCEGDCVSLETCCVKGSNGPCPEGCPCRRTVEGEQVCVTNEAVLCAQCSSSEACNKNERCVLVTCGDITATCLPLCLIGE
jgi:hypothetical protein